MPVTFTGGLIGHEQFEDSLGLIEDPRVIAAALRRAGVELEDQMRLHVSGPRPRRLDVVTGELRGSFETDASRLPDSIAVGTPIFWAEFWEIGAGRRQAKPFGEPALEQALRRIPDFFVDELERARDSAP